MSLVTLTPDELAQMQRTRAHFPYRKIAGVKQKDGTFDVFAAPTMAKARNHARKTGGVLFTFEKGE